VGCHGSPFIRFMEKRRTEPVKPELILVRFCWLHNRLKHLGEPLLWSATLGRGMPARTSCPTSPSTPPAVQPVRVSGLSGRTSWSWTRIPASCSPAPFCKSIQDHWRWAAWFRLIPVRSNNGSHTISFSVALARVEGFHRRRDQNRRRGRPINAFWEFSMCDGHRQGAVTASSGHASTRVFQPV